MDYFNRPYTTFMGDYFPGMLGALSDFEGVQEAAQDEEGLITLTLIPQRQGVIFPNMIVPLFTDDESEMEALRNARQQNELVVCAALRDPNLSKRPKPKDIYKVGVEAAIGRLLRMPDNSTGVVIQGRRRLEIVEYVETKPHFRVRARPISDTVERSSEVEARMRAVLDLFERCIALNRKIPEDAYIFAMNIDDPGWLADLVASTLDLETEQRQMLLQMFNPAERLLRVSILLARELDVLELEDRIYSRVQQEVDKGQRELYLREQMRAIQVELGETDIFQQDTLELRDRIETAGLPERVEERAYKEINRLGAMTSLSPEASVIRTYLEWLLDLPWEVGQADNLDLKHAAQILDADHFGLKKAKERILEYIAVRKLAAEKMKTPILCFSGPPGTGKTSLGKSIAKALGREFARVSLGGVRDEAEIRGHRRTYIGAQPGRILQTLRKVSVTNPLFMLDEIDKLGQDFHGDPASALLEVLDPEQNNAFSDHYLELDYDLSKVLFVTTANNVDHIPDALLDRLEIIEFPGYIEEEKLEIAARYLLPRALESHGIDQYAVSFERQAIIDIIRNYTYEAGVRDLEREISNVCRKIARRIAEGKTYSHRVTARSLARFLGPRQVPGPILYSKPEIGAAQGVAWTEFGGDVLPVEVTLMPGKGGLTMTGQLGEVMQESAQAALSYTRSRADDLKLDPEVFENTDIHIHLPEGATPKDGPSAGVTLAVALVSAFTMRPVRNDIALTGELTLRGRVLPVGGVREKLLAAYRVGIRTVLIPTENKKDLVDLPRKARQEMNIIPVDHMDTILEHSLLEALEQPKKKRAPRKKKQDAAEQEAPPEPQAEAEDEV